MRAAGVEGPRLDAEVLLADAMDCGRAALAEPGAEVPAAVARTFGEMVRRRLRREPVAYILGRKGFRNIELAVDRRVLVPRPETELLVEVALERRPARVLDVGTGSGAIALAVADELPECEVVATDTSVGALEVARANAERLGLGERVEFVEGTLPRDGLGGEEGSEVFAPNGDLAFDLILANLPYIPEGDWPGLQPEVREWEPREALLAGPDGLDAYRALLAPSNLEPLCTSSPSGRRKAWGLALAVEVGVGQAPAVGGLMRDAGLEGIEVRRDLAGIERVVIGGLCAPERPQGTERGGDG